MKDKYLTYVGFAIKAGQCAVGTHGALAAVKSRRAAVLLCAEDASERTKEQFRRLCREADVPFLPVPPEIREATGKRDIHLFAICDRHLADAIMQSLDVTDLGAGNHE